MLISYPEVMTPIELQQIRATLGLSQAKLAEELGLTRVAIGYMEQGRRPITRRTELAVTHLLKTSKKRLPKPNK